MAAFFLICHMITTMNQGYVSRALSYHTHPAPAIIEITKNGLASELYVNFEVVTSQAFPSGGRGSADCRWQPRTGISETDERGVAGTRLYISSSLYRTESPSHGPARRRRPVKNKTQPNPPLRSLAAWLCFLLRSVVRHLL